jgi:hypothetical protein
VNTAEFLDYGAVLAWRSGLPQYRDSALDKVSQLPPHLAARALSLPEKFIARAIANLRANPWSVTGTAADLKIVATAGAFRGFAGQFIKPPRVDGTPGDLVATDPEASWRIYADPFNALLLRCEPQPPPLPSSGKILHTANGEAHITPDGTLSWKSHQKNFRELAGATGIAANAHTVAVTIPTSHHIFLVAIA